MLRPTVSRPVSLRIKPYLEPKIRILLLLGSCGFVDVGAGFDERAGLSFTITAGPRQRTHCRVRVMRESWPCFTVSATDLDSSQSYIATDSRSVSQYVLVSSPIWGPWPDNYNLCDSYSLVLVGRPLWREDGSVFFMCCWPLPAQFFSGPRFGLSGWPPYVTSGRTQQKTPLPRVPLLLRSCIRCGGHVIWLP
jgi:hypothetical protein